MAGESSSQGARDAEKPRKSLDSVIQGVKRALSFRKKPKSSSKAPVTSPEAPPPVPALPAVVTPKPEPSTTTPTTRPEPRKHRGPPGPPPPVKSAHERAAELFKKHGLEIAPTLLPRSDKPPAERVHKEIRMRVHRTCHRCNTSYGADKTCLSCGHKRCKQCPRFPAKKDKGKEKEKVGDKREVKPIVRRRKEPLTLPSRTGGQDLVRKKIRQRVHRTCHRCDTDFGADKVCSKCKHNRCKKCPRDPHKPNKPPGYYDGRDGSDSDSESDRVGHRPLRTYKKVRQRVRWTCSKCSETFQYGNKICEGCGSRRDDTGIRDPLKKKGKNPNKGAPSDSYIEQLGERMRVTSIA